MLSFKNAKPLTFILLFFASTVFSFAQDVAEFGKVSPDLLKKANSSISQGSEAEVIFDVADISFQVMNGNAEIQVRTHVRIKIFNQNGLDEANISIPYLARNGGEVITKLEAQTYNLDASGNMVVSKLDKSSIFNTRVDNRISKYTFTLPEVKSGSVIEYKYFSRRKALYLDDWYFQRNIPVVFSQCRFEYPSEFSFTEIPQNDLPIESSNKPTGYSVKKTYTMRNLPAVKKEPYMTAPTDYMQKLKFKVLGYNPVGGFAQDLRRTWPGIVEQLMDDEDFGLQLKRNIPRTEELNQILQKLTSPFSKMVAVHEYVRKYMAWDATTSIWALDGIKKAWEKKRGNSGEINLILVNLLKDAGLRASPVLVSTKDNGRLKPNDPGFEQFNTVMAYVTIDSNFYVLDATDKNTPPSIVPPSVVYTEGLVINKLDLNKSLSDQDWGWKTLWNEKQIYQKLVNISAKFDGSGKITGDVFLMHKDYARRQVMENVEPSPEKTIAYFTKSNQSLQVKDLRIKNELLDSLPLEHSFNFETPLEVNGDYFTFNLNLFTGLESNPFVAEERYADVFFGFAHRYTLRGSLTLPEGFVFEEPPNSLKMVMPDKSIEMTRITEINGSMARYSVDIFLKKPFYAPGEYEEFREFYKKMLDLLNEQIVIKKK